MTAINFLRSLVGISKQINCKPKIHSYEMNYDEYWENKRGNNLGHINSWQKYRGDWILSKIKNNSTVLDLGCGDGGVLSYIKESKNIDAIGADVSEICLDFMRSKNITTIHFDLNECSSISHLPDVDHILLLEVLEHIPNPEQFLLKVLGKAKKSVFVSFPNSGFISYRLRLLFGRFPVQWTVHPGEHLRFWTYKDLLWWLRELELLDSCDIHVYEGVPFFNKLWKSLFGAAFILEIRV